MAHPQDDYVAPKQRPVRKLPASLAAVAHEITSESLAFTVWSASEEMFNRSIAASVSANRRHTRGVAYPMVQVFGGPGSGRTTLVRTIVSLIPGPLDYFEIRGGQLTEELVSVAEIHLATSRRPIVFSLEDIGKALVGAEPVSGFDRLCRQRVRRLADAILRSGRATLFIETPDPLPESLRLEPSRWIIPPDPSEETVTRLLKRVGEGLMDDDEALEWARLAPVFMGKTWSEILSVLGEAANSFGSTLDITTSAQRVRYPFQSASDVPLDVAHYTAIHEAGHVAAALVTAGPDSMRFALLGSEVQYWSNHSPVVCGEIGHVDYAKQSDRSLANEIRLAAGRVTEEIVFGASQAIANLDLSEMRCSFLERIASAIGRGAAFQHRPTPVEVDAWLPGQILIILERLTAETLRAAREITHANRAAIERFAGSLVAARFLAGEPLRAAILDAGFTDLAGRTIGPGLPWSPADFASYHLDPLMLLADAYDVLVSGRKAA